MKEKKIKDKPIIIKTCHEQLYSFQTEMNITDKQLAQVRKAVAKEWSHRTMVTYFQGLGKEEKQGNRILQFAKNEVLNKISNNKNVKD